MELGRHDAGQERLDADARAVELGCEELREGEQIGERATVDGTTGHDGRGRRPAERDHAADVDDRSGAAFEHAAQDRPREKRGRQRLDVDHLDGLVCRQVGQWHVVRDTRIVDEQIDRPVRGRGGDRVDAVGGRQIRGEWVDRDLRMGGHQVVQSGRVASDGDQVVAVGGQTVCEGPPDAGRRAGDECECAHGVLPLQVLFRSFRILSSGCCRP
ncbi:MAG TPA: hypothetical protein VI076_12765 [Actinopolymorphaceae bacterium]